jgi:hypothetical protein
MRFQYLILLLALLAACNTPGPHFRDVAATRVVVDGSVFDVRVKGDLAEAMRINPEYAPRFGPIRDRAARAMAAVSGCRVRDVLGDQALATGRLDCNGGKGPALVVCSADRGAPYQPRGSPDVTIVCIHRG